MGAILQVFSKCKEPGREAEFNQWYDEVHVPDLLAIGCIVAAQRFKVAQLPGRPESEAQYLALYEFNTDDVGAAMAELGKGAQDLAARGRMSDLFEGVSTSAWVPVSARKLSDQAVGA